MKVKAEGIAGKNYGLDIDVLFQEMEDGSCYLWQMISGKVQEMEEVSTRPWLEIFEGKMEDTGEGRRVCFETMRYDMSLGYTGEEIEASEQLRSVHGVDQKYPYHLKPVKEKGDGSYVLTFIYDMAGTVSGNLEITVCPVGENSKQGWKEATDPQRWIASGSIKAVGNSTVGTDQDVFKTVETAPGEVIPQGTSFVRFPSSWRETSERKGTIEELSYETSVYGDGKTWKKSCYVYLPYGYDPADVSKKYNVVYCQHGNTGSPAFFTNSSTRVMFDNLFDPQKGGLDPVILVFTTFYMTEEHESDSLAGDNDRSGLPANFWKEVVEDILPLVEGTYHTYTKECSEKGLKEARGHRAFAGYSRGGACTWYMFRHALAYFRWFAPMSFYAVDDHHTMDADVEEMARKLLFPVAEEQRELPFYICAAGGNEGDIPAMRKQMRYLVQQEKYFSYGSDPGVNNLYYTISPFPHSDLYVPYYFYNTLPLLFRFSPEERAKECLAEMTLEQKVGQVCCRMFSGDVEHFLDDLPCGVGEIAMASPARNPREAAELNKKVIDAVMEKTGGIPPILETEALCGFMGAGATSFPSGIAVAATFDPQGLQEMTDIIRRQMRSQGVRRACSPVMDIARDPRWGRCGETYGEDAALGAAMSTAFVKGLQSEDVREGVAATGKHFLGYAMGLAGYNSGSNHISPRELREVYARPFQAAISEGKLLSVMNSYGAVDGVPVVGDSQILTGLLREEMKFSGVTVSDYGSVTQLVEKRVCRNEKEAGIRALKAGMDMECPNPAAYPHLLSAVQSGELEETVLDQAVLRILTVKFALGLFENPYPAEELLEEQEERAHSNHAHSLKLAEESVVLLKNDGILPLRHAKKELEKIAVIGPRSNSIRMMYGGYSMAAGVEMSLGSMLADQGLGQGVAEENYFPGSSVRRESPQVEAALQAMTGHLTPTIYEALKQGAPEGCRVACAHGCDIAGTDRSGFAEAVKLAKESDVVIYNCGGKYGWGEPCTSGEGRDTSDLRLPGVQEELMRELCQTGTPVIVVHGDTRPINSLYAKEHAAAVLEVWTPGESGGQAAADVIYGKYNPAGRLPMTAVEHVGQVPMYLSEMRGDLLSLNQENVGFNSFSNGVQAPLWYFGEGLSYSTFSYHDFSMDREVEPDGVVHVSVRVENTGDMDGDEVVQMYIRDEQASMLRPVKELAGFCRVNIPAKESRRITFEMRADQTAFLDADMNWLAEKGEVSVMLGPTPQDIRCSGSFCITRSAVIDPVTRGFVARAVVEGGQ